MFHAAAKSARAAAAAAAAATVRSRATSVRSSCLVRYSTPLMRSIHGEISVPNANPVAIQMVNYALSHARSQRSDESYAQGMLVLEQCLGNQQNVDQVSQDSTKGFIFASHRRGFWRLELRSNNIHFLYLAKIFFFYLISRILKNVVFLSIHS